MAELNPCPLCGSPRPYIIKIHPTKGIFTKYYVACRFCHYCETTKIGKRRAIRAWNRGENLWKY